MGKFRKKPVIIDAVQWNGGEAEAHYLRGWSGGAFVKDGYTVWGVLTLEGFMQAKPGDWIIKGVAGEFYPCDDAIFQETYEEVPE